MCAYCIFVLFMYYLSSFSTLMLFWLGLLTCKNRRWYNLYCVGGDVKPYSINQSINLSITQVDRSKMVEVKIVQFLPYCAHLSSFCGVSFIQKFWWVPFERERQRREGGKTSVFAKFESQYLENGRRYIQSY